jgi:diaminohydroxyphosphoribosylaminopyrimidine deaminase/5-amino-6-(5-phosphoribosylamino)uracil reductase
MVKLLFLVPSMMREKMNHLYEAHPHLKIIPLPNSTGKVDLAAAFKYLADQYHANEVHVEAGFSSMAL